MGWNSLACENWNGALLGYECNIYYSNFTRTETVVESVNTYTIRLFLEDEHLLPKAFSVAAINVVGVGEHCPQLDISDFGQQMNFFAFC